MKTIVVNWIGPRVFLSLVLLSAAAGWRAQAQTAPQAPQQNPAPAQTPPTLPPAAPPLTAPSTQPTNQPSTATSKKQAAAEELYDTSDGQLGVRLLYWYNPSTPVMKTGASATINVVSDATFNGKTKPTPGAELSFPAGKNNTIRISFFRMQNAGNSTAPQIPAYQQIVIWSTGFNPGDYLATSYTLQNAKISLDYLSWPFPVNNARFRLKTLWEVQYTNIKSSVSAPFAPTMDSSGNAITTSGSGSRWFIWPSLGLGIEYMISKHVRFEAKGSGFALPHRSNLWDTEGFLAYRAGAIELDFGAKAFHFKTSPKREEFFESTLPGAYVAIRWFPK